MLPPREERPVSRQASSGGPGASPAIRAPLDPSTPHDTDALARWLRELGIGGSSCLTDEELDAMPRGPTTRAAPEGGDGRFERLLDALGDEVDGHPLDDGVSRDWALFRLTCDGDLSSVPSRTGGDGDTEGVREGPGDGDSLAGEESADLSGRGGGGDAPPGTDRAGPRSEGDDGSPDIDLGGGTRRGGSVASGQNGDDAGLPDVDLGDAARDDGAASGSRERGDGSPDVDVGGAFDVDDGDGALDVDLGSPPPRLAPGEGGLDVTSGGPLGGSLSDPLGGSLGDSFGDVADDPFGDPFGGGMDGGDASGLFIVDDDVPEGFEALAAPQDLWVDVRFNGRKVGTTAITSTIDELLFDQPAEVLAMLSDIEDPERLLELLAMPLAPNADLVCFRDNDPEGCGRVVPAPIAVILDESALVLDLFVSPALQSVQARERARHLPPPERRPTSILSLYSVASDTPGAGGTYDLSARLLAGYGDGHVSAAADYGSLDEQARLNELKLTHFADDHEFTAGTYEWTPGGALRDIGLTGVGFSTSFRTRLDLEQAFSSELVVYLQRRAIVQLVIDGRVQAGDSYAAGNQVIDTSALPDGTYVVEIRIVESDGSTRSEFRTFTKSMLIPPRGEPVFSATAGIARIDEELLPDDAEPLLAGFTVAQRFGDRAALTLGAVQLARDGLGQSDLVYLGERLSVQAGFTLGRERTFGTSVNTAYALPGVTFGASWRSFASDVVREGDPVRESLYPRSGTEWGASINRSLGRLALGLSTSRRAERIDDGEVRDTTRTELRARLPVLRRRGMRGFLAASFRDIDGERSGSLRFDVSFDRGPNLSAGLGLDALGTPGGPVELAQRATLDYTTSGAGIDWGTSLYAGRGAFDSAGARLRVDHPSFAASAAHDVELTADGAGRSSSVAALSTHIGLDRQGGAVGRAGGGVRSGVIVAVDGTPAGEPFDIVVNGLSVTSGEIGTSRFIGLQPFDSYAIKLVPRGVLSNGLGDDVHEFTLYPGSVQRIAIVAETRVLLIAPIVDPSGQPLGSAVVQTGDSPSITDADGLLQAEVVPGASLSVRPLEGPSCTIEIPAAEPGTEVLVADVEIVCNFSGEASPDGDRDGE